MKATATAHPESAQGVRVQKSAAASNRALGTVLLCLGIFGFLVIFHRMAHYVFEFDPQFNPYDYGRFHFLCFFTVQSNLFVNAYLLLCGLAIFGVEKAQRIAFQPLVGALVTTYILITGLVYCCGIPLGFTPPFTWDNPTHAMLSFIQVFHHMTVPPLMLVLWCFPMTNRRIPHKQLWIFGIYPLVYSLFSIVRGAVMTPEFYPYPFYRPDFFWEMLFGDKPVSQPGAYLLMLPVLCAGIGLFLLVARLLILLHDRRVNATRF